MGLAGLEGLPVTKDRIIQLTQQCCLEVDTLISSIFLAQERWYSYNDLKKIYLE